MIINSAISKEEFLKFTKDYNVIPVYSEILFDMETPISILNKFYDKKCFLFESIEGGEKWGRYSFFGGSFKTFIKVYKSNVEILENDKVQIIQHHNKPLNVLNEIIQKYKSPILLDLPRFYSGMVGYLTYEMVSFFEKMPFKITEKEVLASFAIPDELIIIDNIKHTAKVIVLSFLENEEDFLRAYDKAKNKLFILLEKIKAPLKNLPKEESSLILKPKTKKEEFMQSVINIKEKIYDGDIIQAVLSQIFECEKPSNVVNLYRAQRFINPSPYLFFMNIDDIVLIGSSPETMVRSENGVVTLRPIAGTRKRGKNEQEDRTLIDELLNDEKEKAEHLMLLDLGRNDLGKIAKTGTVQVTEFMIVEKYSHVMHLVSNVNCILDKDKNCWDILESVFPAGTLSGAPKIRAMEIISELEKDLRGAYGGATGYISFNGNMDFAITIRTAIIKKNKMQIRAGAGIVADSNPETENQECINKAKVFEKALELLGKL